MHPSIRPVWSQQGGPAGASFGKSPFALAGCTASAAVRPLASPLMFPSLRKNLCSQLRSERSCVLARRGMVCASVPQAAAAGIEMLRRGGNAIDAAIATAAVLCVVEPMQTGLGGDGFALLWLAQEGRLVGLNGSGRAPAAATLEAFRARGLSAVPATGILSATVPGAVHAWEALSTRYGRLPLSDLLEPAIVAAEEGFAVTELVSHYWDLLQRGGALRNDAARATFAPNGRAPRQGERFRNPFLASTLKSVAKGGAQVFYQGEIADAIVATSQAEEGLLVHADLAAHRSTFVEPVTTTYRGITVAELPPNGQGLAALLALNILESFDPDEAPPESALDWHRRIESVKLAFADRDAYVADPDFARVPTAALLDKAYARERAAHIRERAQPVACPGLAASDTTYLCAADEHGNLVSFIQSLFSGFGSGIACAGTGILLQSRGAGFRLDAAHPNCLAPGKRPFHTIMPGMLLRETAGGRAPWMAFGIMGGDIQPQAHLAFVANVVDHGLNPQEAIDRPRFRYLGGTEVAIEAPEALVREGGRLGDALRARGHAVAPPEDLMVDRFGGGQAIAREADGVLVGASDRRKDGCALGFYP
ncbi:MAG TPA: gamma-glutamyltransferase [Myxococcota bacterium]|nr:gamma-glutamyltransferase [Myxococcota bacterium]